VRLLRLAGLVALCCALSGCVGIWLKELEIRQLKDEAAAISDVSAYLAPQPKLDTEYEGRVIIGGDAFNRFLAGLDNYEIRLDEPRGLTLVFEQARLEFKDGAPTAMLSVKAVNARRTAEVKLRIRADILITANQPQSRLEIRFAVREILPDIRFSIFRWHEFWLGMAVLTIAADKHVQSLPATEIPLAPDLLIDINPPTSSQLSIGQAVINVEQMLPSFKLGYTYRVLRAVTLRDGVHVFFSLQPKG
jgi:hypothetical protein